MFLPSCSGMLKRISCGRLKICLIMVVANGSSLKIQTKSNVSPRQYDAKYS